MKRGEDTMNSKINQVILENFGMIPSFSCDNFSNINLVIGENGTGKTFFLKALYSATRAMEEYRRGDDIRTISDVLAEKLRWTFQVEKLGDMVTRSSPENLTFRASIGTDQIGYQFSQSATSKISRVKTPTQRRDTNSIFIPAKEVLSLYSVILKSREVDKSFGFDDTYYDLVKAVRLSPKPGRKYTAFADSRKLVKDVIDGKVEFDETTGKWFFKNNRNQKFSIGATSEGVKKISIMDRLLANGYVDKQSIIFIDEIESALHPSAVCQFLDMINNIATNMDMQFFISSHSYFVIKKLALIAMNTPGLVTCISLHKAAPPEVHDLYDGMPNNSIIDAAIRLYEQEIREGL